MNLTPRPSETLTAATPLDSARAKQLNARRKMQALPDKQRRPELPNINWHDHYIRRVAK
jgi:hypothetical protein